MSAYTTYRSFHFVLLTLLAILIRQPLFAQNYQTPIEITEARVQFEVIDGNKGDAAVFVELRADEKSTVWRYGEGLQWDKGFTAKFIETQLVAFDKLPQVSVKSTLEGDVRASIRAHVYLYPDDAPALEYRGDATFDAKSIQAVELTRTEDSGDSRLGAEAAELARGPVIASDKAAGQAQFFARLWPQHARLKIAFRGGSPGVREHFARVASEWVEGTGLKLDFGNNGAETGRFYEWPADTSFDIRVAFDQEGNWSHMGAQSRQVPANEPTLNIQLVGGLEHDENEFRSTVLHVFGHALGFSHMFQHPSAEVDFAWDRLADLLAGPPNYWTRANIEQNMRPHHLMWMPVEPSPNSVMMYAFPADYFTSGADSPWRIEKPRASLSEIDRHLVRTTYPPSAEIWINSPLLQDFHKNDRLVSMLTHRTTISHTFTEHPAPLEDWTMLKPQAIAGTRRSSSQVSSHVSLHGGCVCRFVAVKRFTHPDLGTVEPGAGYGTGLLIGDNYVITCKHVVPSKEVIASSVLVLRGGEECRFVDDPIVYESPVEELDFAIIQLRHLQDGSGPGGRQGKYGLNVSHVYRSLLYPESLPVTIVHYPAGKPDLEWDDRGRMIALRDNYVAYQTRAQEGSSGAPIFNESWWMVALHRGMKQEHDAEIKGHPDFYKGVRIDNIIDAILKHCSLDVQTKLGLVENAP